jgi:GT2 family glycosyltransferase
MYSEDVELCKTLQDNKWQVWYQPAAKVIHIGGGSSTERQPQREADLYRSKIRFYQRHHGNSQAWLLKIQLIFFTFFKSILHKFLRFVSRGRYGRQVVTLSNLVSVLNKD